MFTWKETNSFYILISLSRGRSPVVYAYFFVRFNANLNSPVYIVFNADKLWLHRDIWNYPSLMFLVEPHQTSGIQYVKSPESFNERQHFYHSVILYKTFLGVENILYIWEYLFQNIITVSCINSLWIYSSDDIIIISLNNYFPIYLFLTKDIYFIKIIFSQIH